MPSAEEQSEPRCADGLRVLVADDNLASQKLMIAVLASDGHQAVVVNNGREVLISLDDSELTQPFDLILMDVQMPEMNGFETTAAIREREKTTGKHIPIIALTAHALAGDRERCLAAGMDDYLSKPIQRRLLQRVMEQYTSRGADVNTLVSKGGIAEKRALDLEAIRQLVGGNVEVLREILQLFPGEAARLMKDLEEAISAKDSARIHRAAHSLKGMLGSLHAEDAEDAALQLEHLGRIGDFNEVPDAFAKLQQRMRRVEQEVETACRQLSR